MQSGGLACPVKSSLRSSLLHQWLTQALFWTVCELYLFRARLSLGWNSGALAQLSRPDCM